MSTPSLPAQVIQSIMECRPVHVLMHTEPDYDNPKFKLIGIDYDFQAASLRVTQELLSTFRKTYIVEIYDPTKRVEKRIRSSWRGPYTERWHDNWHNCLAPDLFKIETWRPNDAKSVSTRYLNLDVYIKNMMIEHKLDFDTLKQTILSWDHEACTLDKIPTALRDAFDTSEKVFRDADMDHDSWIAERQHGCFKTHLLSCQVRRRVSQMIT